MPAKTKRLTIEVSVDTHKRLKMMAVDMGVTMTDIILDCIEKKYTSYKKGKKKQKK